jgi:hypothetical protein
MLSASEMANAAGGTTTAMTCTQSVVICEGGHKSKHAHHCASHDCPVTTYMTCPR